MLLLLELKGVEVLVDLAVQVLGEDAYVGEEAPEHVELLGEQLDPLLQPLVLLDQDLHLLLGLAGAHLGLLAALPHRDVVALAPPPVLVAVLVAGLDGLARGHVVVMMAEHGGRLVRLHRRHVHVELLLVVLQHRARVQRRERASVRRVAAVLHVPVREQVEIAVVPPELLGVHRFLFDARHVTTGRTVRVTVRVLRLHGVRRRRSAAVHRLGHVRQGGSWVVRGRGWHQSGHHLSGVEVLEVLSLRLQDVGEQALVELGVVDEVLEVQGDLRGVEVAQLGAGGSGGSAVVVVLLELLLLLEQRGRLLGVARVVVERRQVVVVGAAVVVHDHRLLRLVAVRLAVVLAVVHLRRVHAAAN